jgi:hypothetical protein
MADISDVRTSEIKEISDQLEALSCKHSPLRSSTRRLLTSPARIMTRILY